MQKHKAKKIILIFTGFIFLIIAVISVRFYGFCLYVEKAQARISAVEKIQGENVTEKQIENALPGGWWKKKLKSKYELSGNYPGWSLIPSRRKIKNKSYVAYYFLDMRFFEAVYDSNGRLIWSANTD